VHRSYLRGGGEVCETFWFEIAHRVLIDFYHFGHNRLLLYM